MRKVYVAGKFRGKTPWHVHLNVCVAESWAFQVASVGALPLCPHAMYRNYDKTQTDEFWLSGTLEWLKCCDAIAMCPGWEESSGSVAEHKWAVDHGLEVFMLDDPDALNRMREWVGHKLTGGPDAK